MTESLNLIITSILGKEKVVFKKENKKHKTSVLEQASMVQIQPSIADVRLKMILNEATFFSVKEVSHSFVFWTHEIPIKIKSNYFKLQKVLT
jgi:hypothetical protein